MNDDLKRIGWIGTGVMGLPMAGHLMDAGFSLTVHTRTKSKAKPLLDRGAAWAESPADAASGADVVFSMVGFPPDVEETHLGSHGTLLADPLPRLIVDMTTTKPSLAVEIFQRAREKGVGSVDAPVSGGDVGAREAKLSIMVGGESDDVRTVTPFLECMGKTVVYQGGPGSGQHTKMVNQILIASTMIGCCEGLLYATRAGLDPLTVIESVGSGAAGSWTVNVLGPKMIQRDFDPGFFVTHFIKDLGIALEEARRMELTLPGLALARQLYESVRALGHDRLGTQALLLALEDMNTKTV
jgi:3-hydroxyisobutyrate dehydrogenase